MNPKKTCNTAIIYTESGCPRCELTKQRLEALGHPIEERSAAALAAGKYKDTEALTELTINGGVLPVVIVGGEVWNMEETK